MPIGIFSMAGAKHYIHLRESKKGEKKRVPRILFFAGRIPAYWANSEGANRDAVAAAPIKVIA
jgi:hypothetical protein